MAIYTGSYVDAGLSSLAAFAPQIEFVLSEESLTLTGGRLVSTRPVPATLGTDGAFAVDLVPNDSIQGNTTYQARATYLDAAANFVRVDLFTIYARAGGGSIADMTTGPGAFNPAYVLWQDTEPNPWPPGWIWVNSATGDVKRKV